MKKLNKKHIEAIQKIIKDGTIPKLKGIYLITLIGSVDSYVGSSSKIYHRWEVHKYQLKHNIHHNYKIQKVFNKIGVTAFNFSILWKEDQKIKRDALYELEQKFINLLNPTFNIEKIVTIPKGNRRAVNKIGKIKYIKTDVRDELVRGHNGKPIKKPKKVARYGQNLFKVDPKYLKH